MSFKCVLGFLFIKYHLNKFWDFCGKHFFKTTITNMKFNWKISNEINRKL